MGVLRPPETSASLRLDRALVVRDLAESREEAQELIAGGAVEVDGSVIRKRSFVVSPDSALVVTQRRRYVGRGGLKLEAALDSFGVDLTGAVCLDVGACTGGFTDCLLHRGAVRVIAVDVGEGQLHRRLRCDHRVVSIERTDIRNLGRLPSLVDIAVVDVSSVPARTVLPAVGGLVKPGGDVIVLLKPQYETPELTRRGVIRSEDGRRHALRAFETWASVSGWTVVATMDCPVPGEEGNREFLVRLLPPAPPHS